MQTFPADSLPPELANCDARLGLVLGSGLGSLIDGFGDLIEIPYGEVPGLPRSAVAGHAGKFVIGTLAGVRILAACGRIHLYEGYRADEVTTLVRAMHAAGCERLILTNAAGTTRLHQPPGQWMLIEDHLNLTGTSPLEGGPNFIDMSEVYSEPWRESFLESAETLDLELGRGVYAGLRGPQYETPAEIQMLRHLGADAVGMSTVLEAIQARALGMEVAGFSCLTNWAAGLGDGHLSHQEVMETGLSVADDFVRLLSHHLAHQK